MKKTISIDESSKYVYEAWKAHFEAAEAYDKAWEAYRKAQSDLRLTREGLTRMTETHILACRAFYGGNRKVKP
jgi:hypothetical protein